MIPLPKLPVRGSSATSASGARPTKATEDDYAYDFEGEPQEQGTTILVLCGVPPCRVLADASRAQATTRARARRGRAPRRRRA